MKDIEKAKREAEIINYIYTHLGFSGSPSDLLDFLEDNDYILRDALGFGDNVGAAKIGVQLFIGWKDGPEFDSQINVAKLIYWMPGDDTVTFQGIHGGPISFNDFRNANFYHFKWGPFEPSKDFSPAFN